MKTLRSFAFDFPLAVTLLLAIVILWGALSPPGSGTGGFSIPLSDKQMHVLAFAVLISPLALTKLKRGYRAAPAALALGGLIEILQPAFGRTADWGDLLADGTGICLGLAIAWGRTQTAPRRKG